MRRTRLPLGFFVFSSVAWSCFSPLPAPAAAEMAITPPVSAVPAIAGESEPSDAPAGASSAGPQPLLPESLFPESLHPQPLHPQPPASLAVESRKIDSKPVNLASAHANSAESTSVDATATDSTSVDSSLVDSSLVDPISVASSPLDLALELRRLADRDPIVRESARLELMGLRADDLPRLRAAAISLRPLRPAQTAALHDIVTHVRLADDTGTLDHLTDPADAAATETALPSDSSQGSTGGFLGVRLPDTLQYTDPDANSQGAIVAGRIEGFCAYRYLRDGDLILAVRGHLAPNTTAGQTLTDYAPRPADANETAAVDRRAKASANAKAPDQSITAAATGDVTARADAAGGNPTQAEGARADNARGDLAQAETDRPVYTSNDLIAALRPFGPGEKVVLLVQRGATVEPIEVTLDARPQLSAAALEVEMQQRRNQAEELWATDFAPLSVDTQVAAPNAYSDAR